MKEIVKNEVLQNMIHQLKDEQYEKLKEVLDMVLVNYKIEEIKDELNGEDNQHYVESFLSSKRLEGCSEKHYTIMNQLFKYFSTKYKNMLNTLLLMI